MTVASQTAAPSQAEPFPVTRIVREQFLLKRTAALVQAIAARARTADVVLAAGVLTETVLANTLASKPLAAKIVGDEVWERATRRGWTTLGLDAFQHARGDRRARIARALRAASLRRVDRVIAPSAYTARLVSGWTSTPPPTTVVYNAAPPVTAGDAADPLPQLGRPRIVMAGRLIPLKRIDGVIRMLRDLPGVTLIVIGSGESERELRALAASEQAEARVHFTGNLTQAALIDILRHSDLLVLNSSTENCPHVLLEASAVGLPVIATSVGGVPELIEDGITGWLVDPGDAKGMTARIREALADPSWRGRASEAARASAVGFSWPQHADAIDRMLRELAGVG